MIILYLKERGRTRSRVSSLIGRRREISSTKGISALSRNRGRSVVIINNIDTNILILAITIREFILARSHNRRKDEIDPKEEARKKPDEPHGSLLTTKVLMNGIGCGLAVAEAAKVNGDHERHNGHANGASNDEAQIEGGLCEGGIAVVVGIENRPENGALYAR